MRKTRFNPRTVDVRGLTRKQARAKILAAWQLFHAYDDAYDVFEAEQTADKKRRKVHTSRRYVRENINNI